MKKLTKSDPALDPIDRALLVALHTNARASIRALARLVGLSAPGCSERLKRLKRTGIISGFSVELNAQALGIEVEALVRVKPLTGKLQTVEQLLTDMPECIVCYKVTGEDSFVCHLHTRSVNHLDLTLQKITPLADTTTSIIKTVQKKLPTL